MSHPLPSAPFFHFGVEDFPHGAGPSLPGWYVYRGPEPDGPYPSLAGVWGEDLVAPRSGYFSRVRVRWLGWVGDAFFRFVWWRDWPAAVWFALFGPRKYGEM